jgi:hypothetical protein
MKKIYVLVQDHDYEGYSQPYGAWSYHPTEKEIFDYLAPDYLHSFPAYGFKTIEETRAHDAERLWETIRGGLWVIEECEFVG